MTGNAKKNYCCDLAEIARPAQFLVLSLPPPLKKKSSRNLRRLLRFQLFKLNKSQMPDLRAKLQLIPTGQRNSF